MFKRMSVLVRLPGQTREQFSLAWERHAEPVKKLPGIRGYIQNHVEEGPNSQSPIKADGFVELLWDSPEDMSVAFASSAARLMAEDEINFLGHGSGYAIRTAAPLQDSRGKLIFAVAANNAPDSLQRLQAELSSLSSALSVIRDDVVSLIPKPRMGKAQPVAAFFHVHFPNHNLAHETYRSVKRHFCWSAGSVGVFRVRTHRFV